jgi:hypothetical protein
MRKKEIHDHLGRLAVFEIRWFGVMAVVVM